MANDEVGQPDPCVFPGSSHAMGYEEYPYRGQGLGLALPGFLLRPFPGSALVGLASPGGFGSGSFRPWLASPGVSGVPSLFVRFAPFFLFLFCVLVRFTWAKSC